MGRVLGKELQPGIAEAGYVREVSIQIHPPTGRGELVEVADIRYDKYPVAALTLQSLIKADRRSQHQ